MRNLIAIIVSVFVLATWSIPIVCIHVFSQNSTVNPGGWGALYLGIILITILWGSVLDDWYSE